MNCSVDGCDRPKFCKGMCTKHYQRFHTHGSPEFMSRREDGQGTIHKGYKEITIDGKQMLEHRHIMEVYLGRKLLPKEQVHHIDEDTLNNSIHNLKIVTNQTHRVEHAKGYSSRNGSSATHKYCSKCDTIKPRSEFMQTNILVGVLFVIVITGISLLKLAPSVLDLVKFISMLHKQYMLCSVS